MIATLESAQTELASIVGAAHVVTDETVRRSLAVDGQLPTWVIYPQSPEQVAAALKVAADRDLAVIPCGNGTKLSIGNPPRRYDIALSLKDLNNVRHYEPADLTVSVEAGMKLGDFERLLERDGLWLPLDPPGGEHASLGGILATNATGPLRLFYGGPRDMVMGLKIATLEGKIINTGGRVVKNVAGYDLSKLFVGSYGTLGVIVGANLKLYPLPAERATFAFCPTSIEAARDLRRRTLDSPLTPLRMVLMNGEAERLVSGAPTVAMNSNDATIWIEAGGSKRVIERYARTLEDLGRAAGASVSWLEANQAQCGWARIADLQSWIDKEFPDAVVLKTVFPIAASEEFVSRARQEFQRTKSRFAVFAQTGVGVVHACLLSGPDIAGTIKEIENLRIMAIDLHGTLVVERCSPEIKSHQDVWGAPGNDFEIMRKLKQTWDPKGILSPGRFVGSL